MREKSRSAKSERDIKTRQHLMERSFARATRYGFDQARWRGLWKIKIQEYLTCAIQNIQTLIKCGSKPKKSVAVKMATIREALTKVTSNVITAFNGALRRITPDYGLFFQRA